MDHPVYKYVMYFKKFLLVYTNRYINVFIFQIMLISLICEIFLPGYSVVSSIFKMKIRRWMLLQIFIKISPVIKHLLSNKNVTSPVLTLVKF